MKHHINHYKSVIGEPMERYVLQDLLKWKNSPYRKPLILKGVRQVGKTWVLKEFGRRYYENTAYFNFDENEEYKQFFETTKDTDRILQNLMLAGGQKILPEKTLIIFDEVQDCPKVINSMKYFCENAPQYHIACAGSLLGIALAKPASFPVGKVNFLQVDPMTFSEFLVANGDENLAAYLDSVDTLTPLPDAFFNPLYEKLKMYYVTGGMPESVLMWTQALHLRREGAVRHPGRVRRPQQVRCSALQGPRRDGSRAAVGDHHGAGNPHAFAGEHRRCRGGRARGERAYGRAGGASQGVHPETRPRRPLPEYLGELNG